MADETTPLLHRQSKALGTFFHVTNSCPISIPLSAADRYLLRCADKTDMMFQAERIGQEQTNSYIKFGTVTKHNYVMYPGCKDVNLQSHSLTPFLTPCASRAVYSKVHSSGNFFHLKCFFF